MKTIYLAAGIVLLGLIFERSSQWGATLLIIVVLSLLLVQQRKGLI